MDILACTACWRGCVHDARLVTALAAQGTPEKIAGDTPLRLDAPDSVWLIRAGWIDVFAVPSVPAGVPVARRHLFRVNVGCLLCGVEGPGPEPPRLLAVGGPGSEVVHLAMRSSQV